MRYNNATVSLLKGNHAAVVIGPLVAGCFSVQLSLVRHSHCSSALDRTHQRLHHEFEFDSGVLEQQDAELINKLDSLQTHALVISGGTGHILSAFI